MMRTTFIIYLIIAFTGSLAMAASDLGTTVEDTKTNDHVGMNPGVPDGRQGGESIFSAVVIDAIPFSDTGNTSDNLDYYDEECPYGPHTSPDVVYSYAPAADLVISVDLCGSGYDTKTFIYDSSMFVVACNDDFYYDETCGNYVSKIEEAYLLGGETYFIVIDGYGGDSGDYMLEIMETIPDPPCIIDCGDYEGEPAIVDGYEDNYNGGCNSPEHGNPFSELQPYVCEDWVYGGQAGWYINSDGGNSRDTDWYLTHIGFMGFIEWTLDAEQETYGFHLGPDDCDTVAVVAQMVVGPCSPQSMTIQGAPGETVWLWVGATTFEAPIGFVGNEYNYMCTFSWLFNCEGLPTEKVTFDGIKSLYR